jgi:hypothetical protein
MGSMLMIIGVLSIGFYGLGLLIVFIDKRFARKQTKTS